MRRVEPISNKSIRPRLLLVAAGILSVVLAACGSGATATPETQTTNSLPPATATEIVDSGTEAGDVETPAPSPTEAVAAVVEISPDALVAAQETVLTGIYQKVLPSVVHIRVAQRLGGAQQQLPNQAPGVPEEFFSRGEGSGFVWDNDGHIVTNHHVVDGADVVTVIFADRTQFEARVLGGDPDSDLAVLELEGLMETSTPVEFGDSSNVQVGQMAVAIGAPFGQEFTMTSGIISAVGRTIRSGTSSFSVPEVIQTDAPINPGNSGGPLLDRLGRVVGINTQIISRSGSNAGVGLAVPINIALRVVPALIADGKFEHPWLGISGATIDPTLASLMKLPDDTYGALVISVIEDGPAAEAGLEGSNRTQTVDGVQYALGGDAIVAIDGSEIRDMNDLIAYLGGNTRPGDTVNLEVIRDDGQPAELPVVLGTRP
jgi:S1-C subfamily serine protease